MKTPKSENNEAHEGGKAGEEKSSEAVSDQSGFFTPNEKIDFIGVKIEPLFQDQVDFETFSKSDFRAVKVKECSAVPKSKKLLMFVLDDGTGTDRVILSGIHAYYEPEELVGKTLIAITNLPPRAMMGIDSGGIFAVGFVADEEVSSLLQNLRHLRKASFKPRPEVNCLKGGGKIIAIFFELQVRHIALLYPAASAVCHSPVIFRRFLNGKRGVVDRCQPGIRITLQQFSGVPPRPTAKLNDFLR